MGEMLLAHALNFREGLVRRVYFDITSFRATYIFKLGWLYSHKSASRPRYTENKVSKGREAYIL